MKEQACSAMNEWRQQLVVVQMTDCSCTEFCLCSLEPVWQDDQQSSFNTRDVVNIRDDAKNETPPA